MCKYNPMNSVWLLISMYLSALLYFKENMLLVSVCPNKKGDSGALNL